MNLMLRVALFLRDAYSHQYNLLPSDVTILFLLASHLGERDYWFISQVTLAKECRLKLRQLTYRLRKLEIQGLVQISTHVGKANGYGIRLPFVEGKNWSINEQLSSSKPVDNSVRGVQSSAPHPCTLVHPTPAVECTPPLHSSASHKDNNKQTLNLTEREREKRAPLTDIFLDSKTHLKMGDEATIEEPDERSKNKQYEITPFNFSSKQAGNYVMRSNNKQYNSNYPQISPQLSIPFLIDSRDNKQSNNKEIIQKKNHNLSKSKKLTLLPPHWAPNDKLQQQAKEVSQKTNLSVEQLITKFRNVQKSKDKTSANWDCEFENFLINERPVAWYSGGGVQNRTTTPAMEPRSTVPFFDENHPSYHSVRHIDPPSEDLGLDDPKIIELAKEGFAKGREMLAKLKAERELAKKKLGEQGG